MWNFIFLLHLDLFKQNFRIFLQALPADGYTAMFEKVLLNNPDITVRLATDYFAVKEELPRHKLLVFTGPIDAFYASQGLAKLEYRSIFWEKVA